MRTRGFEKIFFDRKLLSEIGRLKFLFRRLFTDASGEKTSQGCVPLISQPRDAQRRCRPVHESLIVDCQLSVSGRFEQGRIIFDKK